MIRVLIADDQALVRERFRMILDAQEDMVVVAEATDGFEAIRQARDLEPDVALMDIRMPRLDGLEAARRILYEPEKAAACPDAHDVRSRRVHLRRDEGRRERVPA